MPNSTDLVESIVGFCVTYCIDLNKSLQILLRLEQFLLYCEYIKTSFNKGFLKLSKILAFSLEFRFH